MDYIEIVAKTVNDAITDACQRLGVTSDRLDYVVVEEGSSGFLGIGSKPAKINAKVKEEVKETVKEAVKEVVKEEVKETVKEASSEMKKSSPKKEEPAPEKKSQKNSSKSGQSKVKAVDVDPAKLETLAKDFLKSVFNAMNMAVVCDAKYDSEENTLNVDLSGEEMGVLIGKRGQTLDSLQYLVSLVVNKEVSDYIRIKIDTENYRERRKETLENLAKNIAYKVKRTKRPVSLEPMNPYERRIIHSALQNDKYVTTHSEGEEPFRRVVVTLKR